MPAASPSRTSFTRPSAARRHAVSVGETLT